MGLQDKYSKLLSYAGTSGVSDLSAIEKDNVLYVTGSATAQVKNALWDIYNQIDPDMRAGDLVLNIDVKAGGEEIYEVKANDNLTKIAKLYPGMTWQRIFEANKDIIKDSNNIFPGQKLRIPL